MSNDILLTLNDILGIDDLKRETIEVPEWGGTVTVKELTAEEKLKVGAMVSAEGSQDDPNRIVQVMLTAAAYGLGATDEQIHAVGAKNYAAIERVAQSVLRLSGMEKPDKEEEEETGKPEKKA